MNCVYVKIMLEVESLKTELLKVSPPVPCGVGCQSVTRHTPTQSTPKGTGGDTFNNSVFNDSTSNIILTYTQFILHMATYHMTFKVIYLI
jgi:hypothetical protein